MLDRWNVLLSASLLVALAVVAFFIYAGFVSSDSNKFLEDTQAPWFRAAGAGVIAIALAVAGWATLRIRARRVSETLPDAESDTSAVYVSRLPRTGAEFVGRDEQLTILDEVWDGGNTNVIEIVAWGGSGKSALVNRWRGQMSGENYRGAEKVYGWSFYSQGTGEGTASSEQFISHALKWFEDSDPKQGSSWDKGERLAGTGGQTARAVDP